MPQALLSREPKQRHHLKGVHNRDILGESQGHQGAKKLCLLAKEDCKIDRFFFVVLDSGSSGTSVPPSQKKKKNSSPFISRKLGLGDEGLGIQVPIVPVPWGKGFLFFPLSFHKYSGSGSKILKNFKNFWHPIQVWLCPEEGKVLSID